MNRRAPQLLTLLVLLGAGCEKLRAEPDSVTVQIGNETFALEIVADTTSRTQGLRGRLSIPEDGGMIFIFPDAQVRSFWMAGCLVEIDIMFLDPQGRVTATHRMQVEPPQRSEETPGTYEARLPAYASLYPAQFAIELRAGTIDRLGVRVDHKVELNLPRLKDLAR